ncbi:hypothetical protein BXZ70DRAFT_907673 [Cristinia sonorae]|uniref:Uncharacterized protein n=1 Tax=Cristinia sonorae TaxID=1940300 RepID=A0A8K0UNP5_9AGAR|nr:hypothetical protein BXZ70DRAFT_907673 [Cristinia sonorae]
MHQVRRYGSPMVTTRALAFRIPADQATGFATNLEPRSFTPCGGNSVPLEASVSEDVKLVVASIEPLLRIQLNRFVWGKSGGIIQRVKDVMDGDPRDETKNLQKIARWVVTPTRDNTPIDDDFQHTEPAERKIHILCTYASTDWGRFKRDAHKNTKETEDEINDQRALSSGCQTDLKNVGLILFRTRLMCPPDVHVPESGTTARKALHKLAVTNREMGETGPAWAPNFDKLRNL